MISNEDIFFETLDQILKSLDEGKMDKALELLDKTEPDLQQTATGSKLAQNLRKFIFNNRNCAVFIHEIANGNLEINPPDDPQRQNYVIAQYKQLHANLLHLTWQVQQIAKGDLRQKVSFLGEFSIGFNQMIESLRDKALMEEKIKIQNKELQALNSSKDKFFSIIAHDLRGPLGGLLGLSEIMADESQPLTPSEKKEMTTALSQSARNIFNLLENLLEWAQMQQGHTSFLPQQADLHKLVSDCIKVLIETSRNKGITVSIDVVNGHEIFVDKNMFQSIIRNLVSNAVKFTPKGGEVQISARITENSTTVITVKDTGIGMSKDMINRLFRVDGNSSRPGTEGEHSAGLGLLLCKEFVEKHIGELWVESQEGKGSAFHFTIPSKSNYNNLNISEKIPIPATDESKKLKILIAEDNENSEILIRIIVSPFSYQVFEAASGSEAVAVCLDNPDIDLVLMDINMPEMSGLEAVRLIRQFNKNVIIIAQTAFGQEDTREKALEAGCNEFISKPIDIKLLVGMIKHHFAIR
jgi:signal transduction histidine kinase